MTPDDELTDQAPSKIILGDVRQSPDLSSHTREKEYYYAGALLVGTGILFLTGSMSDIAIWILETFPALGRIG